MLSRRSACAVALCLAFSAPDAFGASSEQARLTINEEVYNVPIGKSFAVRVGGERVTMRIDPQSDRSFEAAGVSFRHPMAMQASDGPSGEGVKIWTIQGPSAAIMLQKYDDELDPKSLSEVLVAKIVERDGENASKPQAVKLTGAERAYQGVQIKTKTAAKGKAPATDSVQNLFTFANEQGVFALLVQDVRPSGAKESEEYTETLRLLGESLKSGAEPKPQADPKPGAAKR